MVILKVIYSYSFFPPLSIFWWLNSFNEGESLEIRRHLEKALKTVSLVSFKVFFLPPFPSLFYYSLSMHDSFFFFSIKTELVQLIEDPNWLKKFCVPIKLQQDMERYWSTYRVFDSFLSNPYVTVRLLSEAIAYSKYF